MEHKNDYGYKLPLNHLTEFTTTNKLFQIVNFCTWSRTINGVKKESLLDHIYTDDVALIKNLFFKEPTFGDHKLIVIELEVNYKTQQKDIFTRQWNQYTKEKLCQKLSEYPFLTSFNNSIDVQSHWNAFEY